MDSNREFIGNATQNGQPYTMERSWSTEETSAHAKEMEARAEKTKEETNTLKRKNSLYDWVGRGISVFIGLLVGIMIGLAL